MTEKLKYSDILDIYHAGCDAMIRENKRYNRKNLMIGF